MERSYHGEHLVWYVRGTHECVWSSQNYPRAHTSSYSATILPSKAMIPGVRGDSRPEKRDALRLATSVYHPQVSYVSDHIENVS